MFILIYLFFAFYADSLSFHLEFRFVCLLLIPWFYYLHTLEREKEKEREKERAISEMFYE